MEEVKIDIRYSLIISLSQRFAQNDLSIVVLLNLFTQAKQLTVALL